MDSILELLYDTMGKHPVSNPCYDDAQKQWDALEPTLPLEVVDAAYLLRQEWGFSCFAAGLRWGLALERELADLNPKALP